MGGNVESGVQTLYYGLGSMFGGVVAAYVKALQLRRTLAITGFMWPSATHRRNI
jgi:hypothetical protein